MIFKSKADTLAILSNKLSGAIVPTLYSLSYEAWTKTREDQISKIQNIFIGKKVAVRSSSIHEDTENVSNAGAFQSLLNVDLNGKELALAIEKVFASYKEVQPYLNPKDQVMIQEMVENVACSGVLFTREIDDGSPYYLFNYDDETGLTDTVTSGRGTTKTIRMHRGVNEADLASERIRKMLWLCRVLEERTENDALDIEFAIDDRERIYLLQVRPIAAKAKWYPGNDNFVNAAIQEVKSMLTMGSLKSDRCSGSQTILANMPDWNPAELIGVRPKPLTKSLFQTLISHEVWHEARTEMGYQPLHSENLLVDLFDYCYVDVRLSFNSFLPANLSGTVRSKLVDFWISELREKPYLQDKVEFDIAQTCFDFCFEKKTQIIRENVLSESEFKEWKHQLRDLTERNISTSKTSSLMMSIEKNARLEKDINILDENVRESTDQIRCIIHLIDLCREFGSREFCIQARHAFIAETLLRSLRDLKLLSEERVQEFRRSLSTVTSDLMRDIQLVKNNQMTQNEFMKLYGHLRPGTFDIDSEAYHERQELIAFQNIAMEEVKTISKFTLSAIEKQDIDMMLSQQKWPKDFTAESILRYIRVAIVARERAKFNFTKYLSAALTRIKNFGLSLNISPKEMSYIKLEEFMFLTQVNETQFNEHLRSAIQQNSESYNRSSVLRLGSVITAPVDIQIMPFHRSEPTFITKKSLESKIIFLNNNINTLHELKNKIVCIENADPGFDWIFTHNISGLITKFGGPNSHMAIRCSELNIPAVIGCGELYYNKFLNSQVVRIDCQASVVRIIE